MTTIDYPELPPLAGYMLGAGIANSRHVGLIFNTTAPTIAALAEIAGIRLGNISSFQRWLMKCPERLASWRTVHRVLHGVKFGEA